VSVRSDTLRSLVFQFFALAAGVVTNIVVARTLGPEGKGVLSFLAYVLFIVISLGGLGLQSASIQHLGKKRFAPGTVAGTQLLLSLASAAVCLLLLFLILPAYQGRMKLEPVFILPFMAVAGLTLVQSNLGGILIGLGRIRVYNWLQFLTPAIWMAGAVLVLGVAGGNRTAGVLTWITVQGIAGLATLAWVLWKVPPRLREFRACASASLRFGLVAYVAGLVWTLLLRSDAMLLGYLGGPGAVGIYSVSVLLAEMLWYMPRSLTLALSPRIAYLPQEEATLLALRAARLAVWAVLIASFGLVLIAPIVVRLTFGPAFQASYRPLLLLLPGIVAGSAVSAISLYFVQQKGRPRINALTSAAGLGVNLLLNLWWIPRYGPSGAAAASSVAYSLVAVLLIGRFRLEPGFSWIRLLRPREEDLRLLLDLLPLRTARADGVDVR
jgi:O-antigen/teichoic acid export membrane protein